MHRISATPGGWNPQAEGVIFIEQTPAPIVFLTTADTDIQTLGASTSQLAEGFPALRVVNLLQLQQQLSIDIYAENVLAFAQVIIVRLLGGRSYWSYGLEVVQETVQQTGAALIVLPGDDRPDPDLISHSTVSLVAVNQLWRYLTEGGVENFVNALKFVADVCLGQTHNPPPPQPVSRVGLYPWHIGTRDWGLGTGEEGHGDMATRGQGDASTKLSASSSQSKIKVALEAHQRCDRKSKIGLLFYRAHYLAGNTAPIDALCQALAKRQLEPVPVFVLPYVTPMYKKSCCPISSPKMVPRLGYCSIQPVSL
jgi:cobaltochelatase CobN